MKSSRLAKSFGLSAGETETTQRTPSATEPAFSLKIFSFSVVMTTCTGTPSVCATFKHPILSGSDSIFWFRVPSGYTITGAPGRTLAQWLRKYSVHHTESRCACCVCVCV